MELLRQASDGQRELQEPGAQAVAEVRKVIGQLEDLRSENSHDRFGVGEVARLKQRIQALEEENPRLSAANEIVK
jgi:cell shape-determining protein MreC